MAAAGAISDLVQEYIPYTWDALLTDPEAHYGADRLQSRIDYVKRFLFADNAKDEAHEQDYDLLIQDYIAKLVTLRLIPAGKEYWMNQHTTVTTVGAGTETATYPDRVRALDELAERLRLEIVDDAYVIQDLLQDAGYTSRRRGRFPMVSNGDRADMVTPDPYKWDQDGDGSVIVTTYPPVVVSGH